MTQFPSLQLAPLAQSAILATAIVAGWWLSALRAAIRRGQRAAVPTPAAPVPEIPQHEAAVSREADVDLEDAWTRRWNAAGQAGRDAAFVSAERGQSYGYVDRASVVPRLARSPGPRAAVVSRLQAPAPVTDCEAVTIPEAPQPSGGDTQRDLAAWREWETTYGVPAAIGQTTEPDPAEQPADTAKPSRKRKPAAPKDAGKPRKQASARKPRQA